MDESASNPLADLDDWEAFLRERYRQPVDKSKFRDYGTNVDPAIREFYRLNHRYQSLDFVRAKKQQYLALNHRVMGIWEAMEFLDTLVDDSDPDTERTQIEHLLQAAEAIRADGHSRSFILTGLIHDLGKILCLFGEPQWAVVGDTFPVGCRFSDKVIFPEYFRENPDSDVALYQSECGVYQPGCGFDQVHLSWGHDEYLYQVVKVYIPEEASVMIRYHSFYAAHREGAYSHLMNEADRRRMEWVRAFSPYDLYSKGHDRPDVEALRPYYEDLIAEFFPAKLAW
jgi:inositol oxygenase